MENRSPKRRSIDAELAFHIDMQTRRFIEAGLDPDVARREARRRLGNLDDVRAACHAIDVTEEHAVRNTFWIRGLGQDITHAWRGLGRAPLFATASVMTLALGIGATTAIFSVVNAALFERLPYAHADRTVVVWNFHGPSLPKAAVSPPEFADIQETPGAFEVVAAIRPQTMNLTGACGSSQGCPPERVSGYRVSPSLFELLGALPQIGRAFEPGDGVDGSPSVVLLSDGLWRRRFGADPDVVGQTIAIDDELHSIVGVMPIGVRFPDEPIGFLREPADLWVPYAWERARTDSRGNGILGMVGRVTEGQAVGSAQTALDQVADSFRLRFPSRYAGEALEWRLVASGLRDEMVGAARLPLLVLMVSVSLVLLISCANVANLMLARGVARSRELAIRTALGAGRLRLARQVLVEAGLVAALGAIGGLALGAVGVEALARLDPGRIPRLDSASVSLAVLGLSAALAAFSTVAVGLAPALRQTRVPPGAALADGRSAGAGAPGQRLRRALVVAEVTLAAVVLVGAGLLVRSLTALQQVETGVDGRGVVVFEVNPPRAGYGTAERVVQAHELILAEVATLPGVSAATGVYPLPMSGEEWSGTFGVEGLSVPEGQPQPHAEFSTALPGYFEALAIPLHAGRDFTIGDTTDTPNVVVVDEQLAARYWPGDSAIGKRIDVDGRLPGGLATIVGVVGHVRMGGPHDDGEPQIYLPFRQSPSRMLFGVASTTGTSTLSVLELQAAVARVDPGLPVSGMDRMVELVGRALAPERFSARLLAAFGGVALLLALVGLHGVLTYLVTERTREIGIRLAIGGRPGQVLRQVVGEGLVLAATGIVAGLLVATLIARTISGVLYGVESTDPTTYVVVAGLLTASALAASYLPARRATRVDPVDVLRQ